MSQSQSQSLWFKLFTGALFFPADQRLVVWLCSIDLITNYDYLVSLVSELRCVAGYSLKWSSSYFGRSHRGFDINLRIPADSEF